MDNVIEKALIGVTLVVLTDKNGDQYSFSTSTKADTKVVIEDEKKKELVIKGVLKASKKTPATIKGVDVEFQDNMFLPEVAKIVQGGEITYDENGDFKSYTPSPAGQPPNVDPFTVDIYTEETDTSGTALRYIKLSLPNGKGQPIEFTIEDENFFAPKYKITTAPNAGEAPYTITVVDELPTIPPIVRP